MSMEDRISDLPVDVLGHILSFLTFKESVRLALLSRRWRMLNPCLRCSNLDFRDFFLDNRFCHTIIKKISLGVRKTRSTTNSTMRKKNRYLLSVLDKIIMQRSHLVIKEFSVTFSWRDIGLDTSSIQWKLDRWINCLAKPGLAVLNLTVMDYRSVDYFSFPLAMLASETTSLQVLSLEGFQLSSPIVAFSSLRSLCFKKVLFHKGVLKKILDISPLLENLQLSECVRVRTLNIRGFLHLKKLEVDKCKCRDIDIDAPTLEVLLLNRPKHILNIATFLPCLKKFEICHFRPKTIVKFQGLQLPMDMFLHKFFTMCPLLEELKISSCQTLQTFHCSSIQYALKTLHLSQALVFDPLENMVKFDIIAPNLEKFYIHILKNFPVISLNASDKLGVTVTFYPFNHPHDQLTEFLGAFNPCRAMKLSFHGYGDLFIEKETRNNFPSPLYGTKCLEFHTKDVTRSLWEYIDYMLWLSPQATNLKITAGFSDHSTAEIVLECIYEEIGNGSEADDLCLCCKLIPITCWRHCLKEVRILEYSGDEVKMANVRNFFLEEVENLSIKDAPFDSDSIQGGLYASYNKLFKETENYHGVGYDSSDY